MPMQQWDFAAGRILDYEMLCQGTATYGNAGGDSGGPVFSVTEVPDYVDLRGIHFAGDGTTGVFSKWIYVDLDLSLEVGGIDVAY